MVFGVGLINSNIYIYPRLTPIEPLCHGNEIWDKIGYNLACVRDFCDIFAPIRRIRGWAIQYCQSHFPLTDLRCHGIEIAYNSACVRDFCGIFAPIKGLLGHKGKLLNK